MQDPVPNTINNTLIGAHCSCPTKLAGPDKPPAPFVLRSDNGTNYGCATQVLWPVGEPVTVMQFNGPKQIILGTGKGRQQHRHDGFRRMSHFGRDRIGSGGRSARLQGISPVVPPGQVGSDDQGLRTVGRNRSSARSEAGGPGSPLSGTGLLRFRVADAHPMHADWISVRRAASRSDTERLSENGDWDPDAVCWTGCLHKMKDACPPFRTASETTSLQSVFGHVPAETVVEPVLGAASTHHPGRDALAGASRPESLTIGGTALAFGAGDAGSCAYVV